MKLPKSLKKLSGNTNLLLIVVGGAVLAYFMYSYSRQKSIDTSNFTKNAYMGSTIGDSEESGSVAPALHSGQNSGPASANGGYTDDTGIVGGSSKTPTDPTPLLPKSNESTGTGMDDLGGANLLTAGKLMGIDTIGSSLRNANLQLRSEPANPQVKIGPWNQSTIEHDTRRGLEMGVLNS